MSYASEVMADDPNLYYRMGDTSGTTCVDNTGTLNGTYSGGFTLNQTSLITSDPGNASVDFNGSTGMVTVASNAAHEITGLLTCEAWVNLDTVGSEQFIVGKWNGTQEGGYIFRIETTAAVRLYVLGGASEQFLTTDAVLSADTTYHLVGTYNNATNTMRIYFNGQLSKEDTNITEVLASIDHPLYIGRRNGTEIPLDGLIDEVAVYPTELSAARVLAHYNAALSSPSAADNAPHRRGGRGAGW